MGLVIKGYPNNNLYAVSGIVERRVDNADFLPYCDHSPNGFSWGYSGSGPSQTAYAMCSIFLSAMYPRLAKSDLNHIAWKCHQKFKEDVIAKIPMGTGFSFSQEAFEMWYLEQKFS